MALLLGTDIGTTGTKTILIDDQGKIRATSYMGYKTYREKTDYAEQDAGDWWKATVHTIRECARDVENKDEIKAISLSAQGGSMVPVDANCTPLSRAIIWMDRRGSEQASRLGEGREKDYFYLKTGWRLGSSLNLVQIKWLMDNEPDIFKKTYKFLSTVEYINCRLTGEFYGDPSNAGITLLMNVLDKKWDEDILGALGISKEKLAGILESGEPIGRLTKAAAEELQIPQNVRVVSGGHDQYCVALGSGAVNPGDIMLSTGTAWVVLGISDRPIFDTVSYFSPGNHVVKGMWGMLGSLPTGGASLEWFRDNICSIGIGSGADPMKESFGWIDEQAALKPAGSDGVVFYPHFTGSPCPTLDSKRRATIAGLDLHHDRYHIARAVMEGVAYDINWMIETLKSGGMGLSSLKALGGATRSNLWMQILSDITGLPVLLPESSDVACIGAAILAGTGIGLFKDMKEGYSSLSGRVREIRPDSESSATYRKLYENYKAGFESLSSYYNT